MHPCSNQLMHLGGNLRRVHACTYLDVYICVCMYILGDDGAIRIPRCVALVNVCIYIHIYG